MLYICIDQDFFIFWLHCVAYRILVFNQGSNSSSHWKLGTPFLLDSQVIPDILYPLLIDTCDVSLSWLLRIMLWIWKWFPISFRYTHRCGIAGSYVSSFFNFLRKCILFSMLTTLIYIPTNSCIILLFVHFLSLYSLFVFLFH